LFSAENKNYAIKCEKTVFLTSGTKYEWELIKEAQKRALGMKYDWHLA